MTRTASVGALPAHQRLRTRLRRFHLGRLLRLPRTHRLGVDVDPRKPDFSATGARPIIEERIGELIADVVAAGRLSVTDSASRAVHDSDITMVCVGTPRGPVARCPPRTWRRLTTQIGEALEIKDGWHASSTAAPWSPGPARAS